MGGMSSVCFCGVKLPVPEGRSRPRKYCSPKCRQKAFRERNRPLPAAMTSRTRWVRHDDEKRPLTLFGSAASVSDPRTWTTYAKASASTVGVGVGIVLGDGLGCIDLDGCIVDGVVAPWAQAIVDEHRAEAALVERSMSGRGLHIFLAMDEGPGSRIRDGRNIETYSRGRYIAVTGDRL